MQTPLRAADLSRLDIPLDRPFRLSPQRPSRAERRAIGEAVQGGGLRQLLHGVYVAAAVDDTVALRCAAIALVLPEGAAIARRTAAWLHGVDARLPGDHHEPVILECVVPAGTEPVSRPGISCGAAPLTGEDLCAIGGLPCTTPLRTGLDLLRHLPPHMGLGAADALAHRGLIQAKDVLDAADRFRGGRGIAKARRLAELIEPLTESFGESWLRLRLIEAGFPAPTAQIALVDAAGRVLYRLDLGWPDRRLAVEYDGAEFHASPERQKHDRGRRAIVARDFDWTAIGVTMAEVFGRRMTLELGVGELLGLQPAISRRLW